MEFISLHFPQLEPFLRNIFPPQFPTTITHFTYGSLCFLEKARILKERKSHYSKFPTTWTITSLLPQLLSVSICFPEDFPQLLLFFFARFMIVLFFSHTFSTRLASLSPQCPTASARFLKESLLPTHIFPTISVRFIVLFPTNFSQLRIFFSSPPRFHLLSDSIHPIYF